MTSTRNASGRLCNHVIRNMAVSVIARKHNLRTMYSYENECNELGIELHHGPNKYNQTNRVTDKEVLELMTEPKTVRYNLNVNKTYCQTQGITDILFKELRLNMKSIMDKNPYKERYENNNDLFLHIRLADAKKYNEGIDYYIHCINNIKHDALYIATDNFNDKMIKDIRGLYPAAKLVEKNPIQTIQFGSTCKYIALSHGTFSAMIGYLGFFSTVYYPIRKKSGWCPMSLFENKGWTCIDVSSASPPDNEKNEG